MMDELSNCPSISEEAKRAEIKGPTIRENGTFEMFAEKFDNSANSREEIKDEYSKTIHKEFYKSLEEEKERIDLDRLYDNKIIEKLMDGLLDSIIRLSYDSAVILNPEISDTYKVKVLAAVDSLQSILSDRERFFTLLFERIRSITKCSTLDRYEDNTIYDRYYELCKEDILSDRIKKYLLNKEEEYIKSLKK